MGAGSSAGAQTPVEPAATSQRESTKNKLPASEYENSHIKSVDPMLTFCDTRFELSISMRKALLLQQAVPYKHETTSVCPCEVHHERITYMCIFELSNPHTGTIWPYQLEKDGRKKKAVRAEHWKAANHGKIWLVWVCSFTVQLWSTFFLDCLPTD